MTERRKRWDRPREIELMLFVQTFADQNGYPPSTREIATELGFKSVESVHRILVSLRDRGQVSWVPNHARTLRVLNPIPASTDS